MPGLSIIGRFARDSRGNFAVISALAGLVLIASIGGVADLAMQHRANTAAQHAADAAALAGAKELEKGTLASARLKIQQMAKANIPPGASDLTFADAIDQTLGTVRVTAAGTIKPSFLPLVKIDSLPVGAVAVSSIKQMQHTEFFFLLDSSESMNIAASDADRDRLEQYTKTEGDRQCAFACHTPSNGKPSNYALAVKYNVKLRIDVLRSASDSMIDKLVAFNATPGSLKSVRVATSGFSNVFKKGLGPSTDAPALKNSIRNFALASEHSNYGAAFDGFAAMIGSQGDGRSATSPLKVALVITDGVHDVGHPWRPRMEVKPIDLAQCEKVKSKGIKLAVLEIKYLYVWDAWNAYNLRVKPYENEISPALQRCASPGFYHLAADAGDAEAKLMKLADTLMTQKLRLMK